MTPKQGVVLGGRYRLEERVAGGGMGEVWRARDEVLTRLVAIKILRAEYADDPPFLERFRGEARHAAGLSHPGIAAVYDYGESSDDEDGTTRPYLVMELVPGEPLSVLINRTGGLGPDQTLDVIGQTALALQAAHDAGVIHRDIKPGNLLVTPDGTVKVTDFGIARATNDAPITRTGQIMGTAHYISPEQAEGSSVTPRSDIYSLGIVAYECLSGRRPFDGRTPVSVALAQVRDEPPDLPAGVPDPVRALVLRMLAKDPAQRPTSAAELGLEALGLRAAVGVGARAGATALLPAVLTPAPGPDETLTTVQPVAQPAVQRFRRGQGESPPWLWVTAALVAVLAVLVVLRGFSGAGGTPSGSDRGGQGSSPSASPRPAVVVDTARYVGRPVDDVVADLRALGLTVRQRDKEGDGRPGTVMDVTPDGRVAPGGSVTVTAVADQKGKHGGRGKG